MIQKSIFTLILVSVFFLNLMAQNVCSSHRYTDSIFSNSQIKKDSNIVYARVKNDAGQMQDVQFDIYYPQVSADTMAKRPLVILIHGGAFLLGNRNDMAYQCREYAKRGFVAATLSYRLGWGCAASDGLGVCLFCQGQYFKMYNAMYRATQDARAATRYLVTNAATFKIDTARIFIGGESAGSITAMMTAFWTQVEAERYCTVGVRNTEGLLDTSGNALRVKYSFKGIINNCGAIDRDSSLFDENMPITSFHDDNDCTVPFGFGRVISCCATSFPYLNGSSVIHEKLKSRSGRYSELHWVQNSLNHCSYPAIQVVKKASCFMNRVMCGTLGQSFSEKDVWSNTVCSSTPTSEIPPSVSASFYPNPVTDILNISLEKDNVSADVHVRINDILGHIVFDKILNDKDLQIADFKNLSKGIYFVEIETEGKQTIKRVVKE